MINIERIPDIEMNALWQNIGMILAFIFLIGGILLILYMIIESYKSWTDYQLGLKVGWIIICMCIGIGISGWLYTMPSYEKISETIEYTGTVKTVSKHHIILEDSHAKTGSRIFVDGSDDEKLSRLIRKKGIRAMQNVTIKRHIKYPDIEHLGKADVFNADSIYTDVVDIKRNELK